MTREPSFKFATKIKAKSKTRRNFPETRLQIALVDVIRQRINENVLAYMIPNGANVGIRAGSLLKEMGLLPGAADLAFLVGGHCYFMELKAPTGRAPVPSDQSPEQIAFEARAFASGGTYIVVNDIDIAIDYLESWGVIKPYPRRSRMTPALSALRAAA